MLVSWATCDAQIADRPLSAMGSSDSSTSSIVLYGTMPGLYDKANVGSSTSYVYDYTDLKQASYASPLLHHVLLQGGSLCACLVTRHGHERQHQPSNLLFASVAVCYAACTLLIVTTCTVQVHGAGLITTVCCLISSNPISCHLTWHFHTLIALTAVTGPQLGSYPCCYDKLCSSPLVQPPASG